VSRNLKIIIFMLAGILLLVGALAALTCEGCGGSGGELLSPSDIADISSSDLPGEQSGVHMHYNDAGELLAYGDDITSLRLISDKGDYFITRGEDGLLDIESLSGLLLETDFLELSWYNAMSFGYSYSIHSEEELKLADFGLDPAQLTIEVEYTDGSTCRLFVGSSIASSPNIYYFRFEGRDEIFVNEFDASFFQGDTYWLSDDIFGDDADDVTIGAIKLTGSAFEQETVIRPHSASDRSDPYYGSKYVFTEPFLCRADDYLMTLLTDELTELVAEEAVCAFPTKEELAAYGLDKPFAVIGHQRNGEWKKLHLARADATTMYAKADGVDCVFRLTSDVFAVLSMLTPDFLRAPEVHVRYFDAVESIRIRTADEDYLFRLERTPLETDETLFEYRAFCGDKQLTLSYYKSLLQVFNSAAAISYGGAADSDTPALTVTIEYFDGLERSSETIRYYPAGTRRYMVEIDGDKGIVVGQMWVDKLIESARLLSENQPVTP